MRDLTNDFRCPFLGRETSATLLLVSLAATNARVHRMIRPLGTVLVGLTLLLTTQSASGGLLILSGDATPVFSLTNTTPNTLVGGNRIFFLNALQGGTEVAILESGPNPFDHTELNEFYNSLPGVNSTLISGAVTASALAGVDLFLAPAPQSDFSPSEIAAMAAFLNSGGTAFLLGEGHTISFDAQNFPTYGETSNVSINLLLETFGSGMRLNQATIDIGPHVVTAEQIAPEIPETFDLLTNQLLAESVGQGFTYGAATSVSGGTPLFFLSDPNSPFVPPTHGDAFVAVENITVTLPSPAVPEPSGLALLVIGAAALCGIWPHRLGA